MRRCLWAVLLSVVLLAAGGAPPAHAVSFAVLLDKRPLSLPAATVLVENRVLVPVRGFVESMGGTVAWDPSGKVTAHLRGRMVTLMLGSREATVGAKSVTLDVPAQLIGDRTYIPLRFVSEGLGAAVHFDGTSVHITSPGLERIVVFDGPLNVRQQPSTSAPIVTTVPAGTRFDVEQQVGQWSRVVWQGGRSGWVATEFTRTAPSQPSLAPLASVLEGPVGYVQVQGDCLGATPIVGGRVFVPVRPTVERLGGQVIGDAGQTWVRHRGREVILQPDSREARVDDQVVLLDEAPVLRGGELFMAARPLATWLDLNLHWDDARRTVSLSAPATVPSSLGNCNPPLPVGAYVVVDAATGLILSEQRGEDRRLIASTVKVMTALLGVELGSLNEMVTVSRNATSTPADGTRMNLRTGQRLTLRDLLYGLMLRSGNDAATAIAEYISGTEANFARAMTNRALQLGARSTTFHNASGLDDVTRSYSTARDLAAIARHAMQNPDFRALAGVEKYTAPSAGGATLLNRNDFVRFYQGATGIKNGWTPAAGHTLVASAYRGDRELIVVVLGASTRDELYLQARRLMDLGFRLADQSWMLRTAAH